MKGANGAAARREAEYYHLFTDWRRDIDFFTTVAVEHGGPVLELGCGTGRVTVEIGRAGVDIDGVDVAPERLRFAERVMGTTSSAAAVRFIRADMRDFALDRKYRLVMFPFRGLQELTTADEKLACLMCVHSHLLDGGLVLIDNYFPSIPLLATAPGDCVTVAEKRGPGGELVRRTDRVRSRDYASQTQQLEVIYDITHPDGTSEKLVIPDETSYMFRFELEHLLSRCGFRVRHVWGGFGFEPFGTDSPGELIVLAERVDPILCGAG